MARGKLLPQTRAQAKDLVLTHNPPKIIIQRKLWHFKMERVMVIHSNICIILHRKTTQFTLQDYGE